MIRRQTEPLLAYVILVAIVTLAACSISLKQQAVTGLQASEVALEGAQDLERSLCFNNPTTERGNCTNPTAAVIHLSNETHLKLAKLFSEAFDLQGKASIALQAWQAGAPPPSDVASYKADLTAILTLAQTLIGPSSSAFIGKAQLAVNSAAGVATALGVK